MQVNSVVSTSLTIEYRIHDIMSSKDFLLDGTEVEREQPYFFYERTIKYLQLLKKQKLDADKLKEIDAVLQKAIQYSKETRKQTENNNKRIQELKKNEYYIGTMSKDKNLVSLFRGILLYYVTNDILDCIRDTFFKRYNLKIENRTQKAERDHCFNIGAFPITQNKIADLMRLSLLNEGGNVIDKKTLNLFTLFIDLEKQTKTAEYKKTLKKYVKVALKELDEKIEKVDILNYCTMNNAKELLQEMGWCDFEKK